MSKDESARGFHEVGMNSLKDQELAKVESVGTI